MPQPQPQPQHDPIPYCWICHRRAPRTPGSPWRHAYVMCDKQLVPFFACSECCYQMASVLLAGIRKLLLWQSGKGDAA